MFYTYMHVRVSDNAVFYIGKGSGSRAHTKDRRSKHWHAVANKHGYKVEILSRFTQEADAFEHECFLISCFRTLGAPLTNHTLGGEGLAGHRHSADTRAKMSIKATGRKQSPEVLARLSSVRKGRIVKEETREKIRQAVQARPPASAEVRAKISAAKKGKKLSPEHKAKLAASKAARPPVSEATRKKIADAVRGRRVSKETGEKIAASKRGKKRDPSVAAKAWATRKARACSTT
jgi:hypothetical protein